MFQQGQNNFLSHIEMHLYSPFKRHDKIKKKILPGAFSKNRSSILCINVCLFELGALEALEAQGFIARMTSCLFLLSSQWENSILEILKSDWSIREGLIPYLQVSCDSYQLVKGFFPKQTAEYWPIFVYLHMMGLWCNIFRLFGYQILLSIRKKGLFLADRKR